jgi:hypothetical protein
MIRFRGNKLIVTGKEERFLKRKAKKLKISPRRLLSLIVKEMIRTVKIINEDIIVRKV